MVLGSVTGLPPFLLCMNALSSGNADPYPERSAIYSGSTDLHGDDTHISGGNTGFYGESGPMFGSNADGFHWR
eukprot:868073-Rhodomonas_salina.1